MALRRHSHPNPRSSVPVVALTAGATILGLATLTAATMIVLMTGTANALSAVGGLLSTAMAPFWFGLSSVSRPGWNTAAEPARRGQGDQRA